MFLRARQFEFHFPRPALVMGIVNVTPDSFSDGGQFFDTNKAVEHGLKLVQEGAEILDIGGESTQPRATPVSEQEELRRVIPVIEQLAARVKVPLSIDTMKPTVARAAIETGASIVNDVAANSRVQSQVSKKKSESFKLKTENSDEMLRIVAETGAGYIAMHMQGTPQTMHLDPVYEDVVREVGEFFFEGLQRMIGCGVSREQTIFDPGIGFGKTPEHNLELLAGLESFRRLERPLLIGASRKSFMGKLLGAETTSRLPASLACACLAVRAGVQIIRAHDVAETVQAIRMTEAVVSRTKENVE
jgi:dihydropteroate synthase